MKANKIFAAAAAAVMAFFCVSCGNCNCKKAAEAEAEAVLPAIAGEWVVAGIEGVDLSALAQLPVITLNTEEGTYNVQAVNIINGALKFDADGISFGEGAMTKMMGEPAAMAAEDALVAAIPAIAACELAEDGTLALKNAEGAVLVTLAPQAE